MGSQREVMSHTSNSPNQILLSKRANIYYLEHCRILLREGRVEYLTEGQYFNIPSANTSCLLLGNGTSITNEAIRMLMSQNVIVGFAGGGGSPLVASSDWVVLSPEGQYRRPQYAQCWIQMWSNETQRIESARLFLRRRLEFAEKSWGRLDCSRNIARPFVFAEFVSENNIQFSDIRCKERTSELLSWEGCYVKALYQWSSNLSCITGFRRNHESANLIDDCGKANTFLNYGNYLCYGIATVALYALGIPYAFPLLHGTTRRGALVFDVADIIKDGIVVPLAFSAVKSKTSHQDFRDSCIKAFYDTNALDYLIDSIKKATGENIIDDGHICE